MPVSNYKYIIKKDINCMAKFLNNITNASSVIKDVTEATARKDKLNEAAKIARSKQFRDLAGSEIGKKLSLLNYVSKFVEKGDIKKLANIAGSNLGIDPAYVKTANNIITTVQSIDPSGIIDSIGSLPSFGDAATGLTNLTTNTVETLQTADYGAIGSAASAALGINPTYVGQLQELSNSIFNAINTDSLDSIVDSAGIGGVSEGADAVLSYLGINTSGIPDVADVFPESTMAATDIASDLYFATATGTITDALIIEASGQIEQLETNIDKVFKEKVTKKLQNIELDLSDKQDKPSNFARDFVSEAVYPKYKSLFVVQFIFNEDYIDTLGENGIGTAFVVKNAQRPNINIEHEEFNLYNFRTKVPKRSEYQPLEMTFWDDNSNQSTSFYKKYLELIVPNSRIDEGATELYEDSTFNFAEGLNSSSYQSLPGLNGHKTIFKRINLYHIYNFGKFVTAYKFFNPKITELALSELDMETSDLSDIKFTFTYDGLHIDTNEEGKPLRTDGKYNIANYSGEGRNALFPLKYNDNGNTRLDNIAAVTDLPSDLSVSSFLQSGGSGNIEQVLNGAKTILQGVGIIV